MKNIEIVHIGSGDPRFNWNLPPWHLELAYTQTLVIHNGTAVAQFFGPMAKILANQIMEEIYAYEND